MIFTHRKESKTHRKLCSLSEYLPHIVGYYVCHRNGSGSRLAHCVIFFTKPHTHVMFSPYHTPVWYFHHAISYSTTALTSLTTGLLVYYVVHGGGQRTNKCVTKITRAVEILLCKRPLVQQFLCKSSRPLYWNWVSLGINNTLRPRQNGLRM